MRRLRTFEALEERRLMWAGALEHDGIGYLVSKNANVATIDRYVIADDSWLADATLTVPSGTITSIAVGDVGIYAAYGSRVDRFDHAGGGRVEVVTSATKPIEQLFVDEVDESMLIMIHAGGSFSTLDLETGELQYSVQTNQNTVYAHDAIHNRLVGSTPSRVILGATYSPAGLLETSTLYSNSTSSSAYPVKIWISPDGEHLFSDVGRISDTVTASDAGRFETGVEDIVFIGSMPVVRYNDRATLYTADTYLPVGSLWIFPESYDMLASDDALITFRDDGQGFTTTIIPLANFNPPRPDVTPHRLSFQPDAVEPTSDGTVLLLSGSNRSVFRWDAATQAYLPTISLYGVPSQIVYSEALNTAFLAYQTGLISKINLNAAEPREELLRMLDSGTRLAVAGEFLLTQSSGDGKPITAYDAELNLIERKNFGRNLVKPVWNETNHTLYFNDSHLYSFTLDTANPTTPLSKLGQYQSATSSGSTKYSGVVRISPDGSLLITGSGHILNALTLVREERTLPHIVTDLAWLGSRLYTVRQTTYGTEIKRWNAALDKADVSLLRPGTPLSLYAMADDRLLAVSRDAAGIPQFTLLDADLNVIHPAGAFTVVESGGLTTASEDGQTDTLEVTLSQAPTSNVVLQIAPYDAQVAVSAATLTFTPENWNVPQVVQVLAPDDTKTDWNSVSYVVFSVDEAASDAGFRGFGNTIVNVTVEDNDTTVLAELDHDGIRYTFAANHYRVTRFDLASGTWLTPLVLDLPALPTGAAVNAAGIFVTQGKSLYRFDLDGTGRSVELEYPLSISRLWSDDNLLILLADATNSKRVISYDTALGQIVSDVSTTLQSATIDRTVRRLVGRAGSNSLGSLGYDRQGRLFDFRSVSASTTFLLLPGGRLVDAASNIRSSATLEVLGRLEYLPTVSFSAMELLDNGWIIGARLTSLELYDTSFTQRGKLQISGSPQVIRLADGNIYLNYAGGISPQIIPYAQLENKPARPPERVTYTPKEVLAIGDGYAYVNARLFAEVWRWNTTAQIYEEPLRLKAVAESIAYSEANARLYIGYASGEITQIDLSAANPVEQPYAEAGAPVAGLVATGPYLFVVTTTARKTFSPAGVEIDSMDYGGGAVEYFWNLAYQSVYHRDVSSNKTFLNYINVDGSIPGEPLGGISNALSIGSPAYGGPVTISPDGNKIVFAGGAVFDVSLDRPAVQMLPSGLTDAAYLGDEVFTLRTVNGNSELQRWNGTSLVQTGITVLPGTAQSLTRLPGNRLLAVTISSAGQPTFRIFDHELIEVTREYGLVIQESNGGTRVSESGTSDTLEVSLSGPPPAAVTINVISSNTLEATVSPASLVFTPENWNVPQLITVTGVDDGLTDKTQAVSLVFNAVDEVVPARIVTATVVDNENVSLPIIEHGGIAYFVMTNESRVDRLDQATGTWLPSIYLPEGLQAPTAAEVDADSMYIAYGRSVYRYGLDGTPQGVVLTADNPITYLFTDDDLLLLVQSTGQFESYDKSTGAHLYATVSYALETFRPTGVDRARNRLFGLGSGNSLVYAAYGVTGQVGGPYRPTNDLTTGIWTSPDGAHVFDSNGKVRDGSQFTPRYTLPGGVTEVAYHGADTAFVLRGNKLSVYSADMMLTDTLTMNHVPHQLVVGESHFITLTLDITAPGGYRVRTIPLSALVPVAPQPPLDPRYTAYTPDAMHLTSDGTMLLLDKSRDVIFRWNTNKQRYDATIPLSGDVDQIAYHGPTNSIYVAYATKQLVRIDLDDPALVEQPVIELAQQLTALGVAGEYLVAMPGLQVLRADGTLVDAAAGTYNVSRPELVWNDARQQLYTILSNSIGIAEINANGATYPGEVPGGVGTITNFYPDPSYYNVNPGLVRVSDDGQRAVTGRGYVFDWTAATPPKLASLGIVLKDAVWMGDRLYTVTTDSNINTRLEARAEHLLYSATNSWLFSGTPHSLRVLPGERLLLTTIGADGRPIFRVLDANWRTVPAAPAEIVGRHLFYNNSKFDQVAPGVDVNDAAIAVDKTAYLPGSGPSGLANVSSYSRGINGVMIDIVGAEAALTLADFAFRIGTTPDPSTWRGAPIPTGFTVRTGAGAHGSDRVEITWPDGAIANTWLQVQVKATSRTRLSNHDAAYFGSKIGETIDTGGDTFSIGAGDELLTRHSGGVYLPITAPADHNKDGIVNAADALLVRANFGHPPLVRLALPVPPAPLVAAPQIAAGSIEARGSSTDPTGGDLHYVANSLVLRSSVVSDRSESDWQTRPLDMHSHQLQTPELTSIDRLPAAALLERPRSTKPVTAVAAVFQQWVLEADDWELELLPSIVHK